MCRYRANGAEREFDAPSPEFGIAVGVMAFDMSPPFATISDHNAVKYQVSDHRPIWAWFRIDLGNDA